MVFNEGMRINELHPDLQAELKEIFARPLSAFGITTTADGRHRIHIAPRADDATKVLPAEFWNGEYNR